jgi:hypothetical protein
MGLFSILIPMNHGNPRWILTALHSGKVACLMVGLYLAPPSHAGEMRTFRSADGKPLRASFEGMAGDLVTLKREDGKVFEISKDKLSVEDQKYLLVTHQGSGDEAKKINRAAGHELATGVPFHQRKAEEISQALKLPPESQSKYDRSWRRYSGPGKGFELFGAVPYSVALYAGEDGMATDLSIVYANKGDFGSTAGFAQDHFKGGTVASAKTLAEAMNLDEAAVAKSLTEVLGAGKTERYGEGSTRRKITRWDWNGHSFLLSNQEGEYVSLAVVPTATANTGGRSTMTRDAEVRQRLTGNVKKSVNGDVYLTEIPMVDQGPKGYCVPATFERVMRTMGLEADMYLLAMVGQSGAGGGTSVELLLENLRHQVLSKGRRIKEEELKQLRIRDIKRYLDQGIPVMWTLCSMEEYNKAADKNTKERLTVTDWKAYGSTLAAETASLAKAPKPSSNYHICMIVGYNETTQELAVSDSWGPSFERRWVPLAMAEWASMGKIIMILP